jgi:erythromycin esterase-like protein
VTSLSHGRRFGFAVAFALFSISAARAQAPAPLPPGIWRLQGTDPNLPQGDLEPLRRIVGDAGFVGLGEPVHTSGGFYQAKHRVFRFLVEEMGFRALGMETPWIRADRVETYVQTCQGTARAAARGLLDIWQSTEVAVLARWMCEWNRAHPQDRVHFYGFDVQTQAREDGRALIDFLHRLGIRDDDPRIAGIRVCDGVETDYRLAGRPFPAELYRQCQDALAKVAGYFDREESKIQRRTSKQDLGWARVHLVGQQAWQEQIFDPDPGRRGRARDRGMAYVAQAIRALRFPQARVALWAHNGHLAKKADATSYAAVQMGTLLAGDLGSDYVSIGLAAYETLIDWAAFHACGPASIQIGESSIEHKLHDLGLGAGVLADLTARPRFFPRGAVYTLASARMVPAEQFNAILYLEVSPKMHPLAWPVCR